MPKHEAWAAAISSSGLVLLPGSSVREAQVTSASLNSELLSADTVPRPSKRFPYHVALALRSAMSPPEPLRPKGPDIRPDSDGPGWACAAPVGGADALSWPAARAPAATPVGARSTKRAPVLQSAERRVLKTLKCGFESHRGHVRMPVSVAESRYDGVMPKQKRSFDVLIEAKLSVEAFDEASAQRKVERALARPHLVDADVWTTGQVSVYGATPEEEQV